MDDSKQRANMEFARQVIGDALVKAVKEVADKTGAKGVQVDAHLIFETKMGICAGGAAIMLVYPLDHKPTDPEGAKKLVDEVLNKLKKGGKN